MIRKRVLWSWTDLPSTLSNSLADRYWIPISLLSWRCGLAGAIPPIAPPQQNRQFRYVTEMFPVYMGIAEVWDEYGYWASSFFCVRFGLFYTWKKKKKKKKMTRAISHISINSHRNQTRPRGQDHSLRSGSQSKHRIHYIIPAQGAIHIIILIIKNWIIG